MKSFAMLIIAATAAPAFAAVSSEPAEAGKKERLVCRSQLSSESRLSRTRICLTAEQWKARDVGTRADESVANVINKGVGDGFGTEFRVRESLNRPN